MGYFGYALNVKNKYGDNNKWLGMDGNDEEWRILYHGTKHEFLKNIVRGGLREGKE
jgi:RNA:NAD 2'-phosphotransferase (TPT1/KptA family)